MKKGSDAFFAAATGLIPRESGPAKNASDPFFSLIADDLTGACDAGVQFVKRGLRTTVWLSEEFARVEPGAVAAITTNTRRLPTVEARAKTTAACRMLSGLGARVVYAKIDSTFHGHPGVQITAVMEACDFTLALVCPAFPEMGRTVKDGWLNVSGAGQSVHLASHLRGQGAERVYELSQPDLEALRSLASSGSTLVVLDADSTANLAAIAAAWRCTPASLPAGSAGLAAEVAALLAAESQPGGAQVSVAASGSGPVMLFVGSTNPVTDQQVRRLTGEDRPSGPIRLIRLDSQFSDPLPDLQSLHPRGLVLTGGDTALQVLRSAGVSGIQLRQEILPGIPWGTLLGGPLDGMPVVTKAGGFGPPDALVRAVDFLSTLGNESE